MRALLIWLVLACLLPGVVGATVLFIYEYREGRAQLEMNTLQTARALAQAVDSHLLRAQAVAQALATADSLARHDLARFHQRAREAVALSQLGTNVVLRDEAGRQLLNTAVDFGSPLAPQPAPEQVRGVFATGRPTVSDVFIGPVLGRPIVSVDVPVIIDGRTVYALGVGVAPEHFNALLGGQNLPPDWVAGVFDSTGSFVGRTLLPEQVVGRKAPEPLLGAMLASPEGWVEVTTIEGVPVLSSFSRAPVTNWRVSIGIPRHLFQETLLRTLSVLGVGVAVLFGIGLVLARWVSGRIARSVEALTAPAAALGGGASAPVPRVHIREAAEVAAAIGRAGALLAERAAALRAREAELAEAHRLARFGTWHWDLTSGEVRTSASIREIYGREVPSFPQQRGTVLTEASWERVNAASQAVMHTGEGYALELEVNHGGGGTIWIDYRCEAVCNDYGEVVALRGTIQDITERKRADERLRESAQALRQFKFFSDHANDGNLMVDQAGRIRYANRLACERLGYGEAELLRLKISDIDPLYPEERFQELFSRTKHERIAPFEGMHRRKDGTTFPVEVTVTVLEVEGEWLMFATSRDISERKLAEERLREASLHDALTGLPNRALVFEYCGHLLAAARRGHGQGALLFIDLDRFKPINDLYGHEAGDRVLQEVGRRLVECTRHEDLVGRLGGDEFVIVLPYLDAGSQQATVVAQHVVERVSRPYRIDSLELTLSPSVGVSFFPEHATDVSTLIHAADLAMYQAKQSGRGNYRLYTPELDRRAGQALSVEMRLKNALRHDGLKLHYQPVVDIASGRMVAVEALVRLADGDGDEPIGPDGFIPIAEATGLIGELGEWVATEACRQHEAWLGQGLKIAIAINVSPLQFKQRGFADKLGSIIAATGMDPACLEIEVTESALMENVDDAVETLKRIKALGVKVALDDFGTGYSSLSSLSSLPLDKLKVDRSFVRRIERDQASRAVTEAIITLGRSLKLDVVGEGIESAHALGYLKAQGCNQAQGFWFSRPLPASEFAQWYRQQGQRRQAPATGRA